MYVFFCSTFYICCEYFCKYIIIYYYIRPLKNNLTCYNGETPKFFNLTKMYKPYHYIN